MAVCVDVPLSRTPLRSCSPAYEMGATMNHLLLLSWNACRELEQPLCCMLAVRRCTDRTPTAYLSTFRETSHTRVDVRRRDQRWTLTKPTSYKSLKKGANFKNVNSTMKTPIQPKKAQQQCRSSGTCKPTVGGVKQRGVCIPSRVSTFSDVRVQFLKGLTSLAPSSQRSSIFSTVSVSKARNNKRTRRPDSEARATTTRTALDKTTMRD